MTRMIRTVVFDFGQVLVHWDPTRVWEEEMSSEDARAMLHEADFFAINRRLDAGARWADVRGEHEAALGERVELVDRYLRDFPRSLVAPVDGMEELVLDLQRADVRTLGLTNWSAETIQHAPAAAPAIALMEGVVVSGEVGVAKPDPAIYRLLLDRFDLEASETAFVDDSPPNVEAAREAGIHAEVFAGADAWRRTLREWGAL
ncbi:HAD-IA family hydrolase [Ruania suaedae]|uniref:HAD-IA family hydrolase n=1 Tax=Ruania suaedae TaxID=2897774 RepID=UPI001E4279BF|nr:HAD-IA family hydrolase [Ruania suaedae]UFU04548.1 HAD-IA family hydrolase [Ruania suaedae]